MNRRHFIPVDDGIYYIGRRNDKEQYPLQFYRFSSEKSEMLTPIDGLLYQGLTISPDRTTFLFSKTVKFHGADIMMIDNFKW